MAIRAVKSFASETRWMILRHVYLRLFSFFRLLLLASVFDRNCAVSVFESCAFPQECFSFGVWVPFRFISSCVAVAQFSLLPKIAKSLSQIRLSQRCLPTGTRGQT